MRRYIAFAAFIIDILHKLWRAYLEQRCKALEPEEVVIDVAEEAPPECLHDWVQVTNIERRRDRIYARCSQCPAVR